MNKTSALSSSSALCVATVVVAGFLCGCTSTARFSVQAERQDSPTTPMVSYRLKAGAGPGATAPALATHGQVLRDVRTALASRGMFEAPAGVAPALEIEVELGIGPAHQKTLAHRVPVYAEGSQPYTRTGESRHASVSSETMPRKIGEREVTAVVTVHPKHLRLTARAFRPEPTHSGETPVVWSVVVTNEDESTDLASYSRLMIAAAMDWIGRATQEPMLVEISDRDRRVAFLAAGQRTLRPGEVADGRPERRLGAERADG